jgi:hypothetical protein
MQKAYIIQGKDPFANLPPQRMERAAVSLLELRMIVAPRLIRTLRTAGVVLFVSSLLLPVCRDILGQSYVGWSCAWNATGMGDTTVASLATEYLIVTFNLIVVVGFVIGFSRHLRTVQLLLGALLLLLLPTGAVLLFLDHVQLRVGAFLWIASALLLVIPSPFLVPARYRARTRRHAHARR